MRKVFEESRKNLKPITKLFEEPIKSFKNHKSDQEMTKCEESSHHYC